MRNHTSAGEPANRYGSHARLPPFDPERHVPTLALINTASGSEAGRDILAIARRSAYYQDRFFDIREVAKDKYRGGLLDVLRVELDRAKEEAKAMGLRVRLISGGGDGTVSFALSILFAALKADDTRSDEGLKDSGNGFIWPDQELAECFPAIAQLPLGSANDFANSLGWGRRAPGEGLGKRVCDKGRTSAEAALQEWISSVLNPRTELANFDVWGIVPAAGEPKVDFKICSLGGPRGRDPKVTIDGTRQLLMTEEGGVAPLFVCLYFSAGFGGYMTARFQINRRKHAFTNRLEYMRQAAGMLVERRPPQLNRNLGGVRVTCGGEQYFPPRGGAAADEGERYREVGFLNINWQAGVAHGQDRTSLCGRICSTREPAKFNDSHMDMYRLKLSSAFKNPGFVYQTDKKAGPMVLDFGGGHGKGVFFQWDGEARFAFSPTGSPFSVNIRKILNIPVVLGPWYDARVAGDPHMHDQVCFSFAGSCVEARTQARERILQYVRGELFEELNASHAEIQGAGLPCQED